LGRDLEIKRFWRCSIEIHKDGDDEKDADEENDHVDGRVFSKKI
jgi:hypothetical protein